MDTNKIVISLQIPKDFYDALKKMAEEECTSVSYLIRRMIIKEIRERQIEEGVLHE